MVLALRHHTSILAEFHDLQLLTTFGFRGGPQITKHLADLKSPWNCPHGRPTMRHLVDLTTLRRRLNSEDEGF
ncbi:hypothetical protein AgCh_037594 [Apium graveolens]